MHKSDLEHIIRAASAITNEYEIVVVGSQSILGSVESPPQECLRSMEADIYVRGNERLSDLIDGAIGEGSQFHDSFGYYAQGVDESTSILPTGWQNRLIRLQSKSTDGKVGYCLDVTDLFLAKCAANREKDRAFNLALLRHGVVDPVVAISRIATMPLDGNAQERMESMIRQLASEACIDSRKSLVSSLQKQGLQIQETKDGVEYIGTIKQITHEGLIVQGVSRTAVVIHDRSQLDGVYEVGQLAEIKYQGGRGHDKLQGPHLLQGKDSLSR